MIMKALKIVVVMLVLCLAFSGVAVIANSNDDSTEKKEVKSFAQLKKGKICKPGNA